MRLADVSCLVTGGGSGIGRAIARRLAAEGARVCVADVDEGAAGELATEIAGRGEAAFATRCDVTERSSVRAAVAETARRFGSLDVIFNNAGIAEVRAFLDVREEDWQRVMSVNALGVLICMQEAATQMIAQGTGGKIVNTASIAGKQGYPQNPHYSASKSAVVSLTQAGARAFGSHGITVNAFCPGIVATKLWEQLDREFVELGHTQRPGQAMEELTAGIILGRVSAPEDLTGLAVFLASPDSDYVTGQAINVDGGIVLD